MLNIKALLTKLIKQLAVQSYNYSKFTYATGFNHYATSGSNSPMAHKCGRVVNLTGCITSTVTQSAAGQATLGKVPSGCEPIAVARFVTNGSGQNRLCLIIETNGTIKIERYGVATNIAIPATAWLNIGCTYISAS